MRGFPTCTKPAMIISQGEPFFVLSILVLDVRLAVHEPATTIVVKRVLLSVRRTVVEQVFVL